MCQLTVQSPFFNWTSAELSIASTVDVHVICIISLRKNKEEKEHVNSCAVKKTLNKSSPWL